MRILFCFVLVLFQVSLINWFFLCCISDFYWFVVCLIDIGPALTEELLKEVSTFSATVKYGLVSSKFLRFCFGYCLSSNNLFL